MTRKELKEKNISIINELLFTTPLLGTRFTLALAELLWAINLFWVGDTFARPTYAAMASAMSEEMWGAVFLITSIIQWYILFTRNFHTRFSVCFSVYNTFLWWYVYIGMYMSLDSLPAGISGGVALCFASSWVFIRSGIISGSTVDSKEKLRRGLK